MKIEYRNGDLLDTDIKHILHGCNARGVMGSGVAKLIRQKWPKAYEDYAVVYNSVGLHLGSYITSIQSDGKIVINGITQETYGKTGVHISYWAIANIIRNLNSDGIKYIAMPQIGAGLGGGDWRVIEAIIENESKRFQPVVYIL
jgi:O-acetyl-ADP-ribose deacetylase (regulator of RNase III)